MVPNRPVYIPPHVGGTAVRAEEPRDRVVLLLNGGDDFLGVGEALRPESGGQSAVLPQLVVLVVEVFDERGDGLVPRRGVEQDVERPFDHQAVEPVDGVLVR